MVVWRSYFFRRSFFCLNFSIRLRLLSLLYQHPSLPMEHTHTDSSDYRLDIEESYELPQFSFDASPAPPSLLHRPGYHRISSIGEVDTQYYGPQSPNLPSEASEEPFRGLAIANLESQPRNSVLRVPFNGKTADSTPRSADFLLSPSSTRISADEFPGFKHQRNASSSSSIHQPFEVISDTENLTPKTPRSISKFNEHSG